MTNVLSPPPDELSFELSKANPEAFAAGVIEHMGRVSIYGAQIWNFVQEANGAYTNRVAIDPTTWVSCNEAEDGITLGSEPMPASAKNKILFHDERFTYADEVAYRLLHEVNHSFLFLIQSSEGGQALLQAAQATREATDGNLGLTALGSLDYYKAQGVRTQLIEDSVEFMNMFAWEPGYASEFTDFLADPSMSPVRDEVGLVTLSQGNEHVLLDIAKRAVEGNLDI